MKKLLSCFTLMAPLSFAAPQHVGAQGIGAILDWIHELSGPQLVGPAFSYYSRELGPEEAFHWRVTAAYHSSFDSDNAIDPDGSKITKLSIQPTLEIPITGPLEIEIGAALHRFGGDADGFWHWSFPAYGQVRVPIFGETSLRMGLGGHYWLKFAEEDFAPLVVDVNRNGGEFTFGGFLGFDVRLR